ncbi:hypothetical protein [Sphingomonas sanguinis]|uniref:hypothetical protein n=1 Tax=Sphingomonas sanguinis TaxID=33051 RepID=UPI000ACECE99|nr:hypothetical protein [Sphingomonas sanguinis]
MQLDHSKVNVEDREKLNIISRNIYSLESLTKEFASCLDLTLTCNSIIDKLYHDRKKDIAEYDQVGPDGYINDASAWSKYREQQNRYDGWARIAVRSGALAAYGYQEVMQSLSNNIAQCQSVAVAIDRSEQGRIVESFKRAFPTISGARTSAAHPGEFGSTSNKIDKHVLKSSITTDNYRINGDGINFFIDGDIQFDGNGATYTATFKGKMVEYNLRVESLTTLRQLTERWKKLFSMFDPWHRD